MNLLDSIIRLVVDLGINVWVWEAFEDVPNMWVGF